MSLNQITTSARRSAGIAGILFALAPSVVCATPTAADISALRNANCTISASSFVLSYDPLAKAATERVASVTVRCQAEGPMHLSVEADGSSSHDPLRRTMMPRSTGNPIIYSLYVEGQPFGDGTGGTHRFERDYPATNGMITATFLVTLIAPAGQDATAGDYADHIGLIARY
jgi:spore coat protein U-like protein